MISLTDGVKNEMLMEMGFTDWRGRQSLEGRPYHGLSAYDQLYRLGINR